MIELLASVVSALERASACPCTYVLSFESVVHCSRSKINRSVFASALLSFNRLALPGTTTFLTRMTTAIESSSAYSHAKRRFKIALMADGGRGRPSASTADSNSLEARCAIPSMAGRLAQMVTTQRFQAGFATVRYNILTSLTRRG